MTYEIQLIKKKQWNDTLETLTFSKPDGFLFQPGQFVLISETPDFKQPRSFTISSAPEEVHLELTVRISGAFTQGLHTASIGTSYWIRGPFGRFILKSEYAQVAFIAGGVGITPFLSMLKSKNTFTQDRHMTLFYSVRNRNEIIEKPLLDAFVPHIDLTYAITQEITTGSHMQHGRVDAAVLRKTFPDVTGIHFFICGPPQMVSDLKFILESMSVPIDCIHIDDWSFANKLSGNSA